MKKLIKLLNTIKTKSDKWKEDGEFYYVRGVRFALYDRSSKVRVPPSSWPTIIKIEGLDDDRNIK
jgi:hypothetical protein